MARRVTCVPIVVVFAVAGSALRLGSSAAQAPDAWWSAGDGRVLPATVSYENPYGRLTILNTVGRLDTKGHPFFEPIGANGRACVTCHQPADGMSLSVETIQRRWLATSGRDPLFAAIDGKNCPESAAGRPEIPIPCCSTGAWSASLFRGLPRRPTAAASRRSSARGGPGPRPLQYEPGLRPEQSDAVGVRLPPALRPAANLIRHRGGFGVALHRQERPARRAGPRDR